ncbi:zinc-binding protein A33-like [Lithobates pipiens]
MACAGLRENLLCSVCKEIFNDPVTLPCGHNFCQLCIIRTWDNQEDGESTCPLCVRRYKRRPELTRNIELAKLSAAFQWSWRETRALIGATCSYCIDRPERAAKQCVPCKVSLCAHHLKVHNNSLGHIYIKPNTTLYSKKCCIHNRTLEFYCAEDDSYMCAYCKLEETHVGHNIQSLDEASEQKKNELRAVLERLTPKKEEMDKKVKRLRKSRKRVQETAAHVTALFRDIRRCMEDLEKKVLGEISRQEERVSLEVSDRIQKTEMQLNELSEQIRHIEMICNLTDPMIVLQAEDLEIKDICGPQENKESQEEEEVYITGDLEQVTISQMLHKGLADIVIRAKREFNVQEASETFLDINTAADDVALEGLKTAIWSDAVQNRPPLAKRFESFQVLSTQSFNSGKHYWELEMSPSGNWRVGMAYASIQRKHRESWIGDNEKSWCLLKSQNEFFVMHDSESTPLQMTLSTQKLRIYLDYESGELSF